MPVSQKKCEHWESEGCYKITEKIMQFDLCTFIRRLNIMCALFAVFVVFKAQDYMTATCVLAFTSIINELRDLLTHAHMGAFELKQEAKRRRNLL